MDICTSSCSSTNLDICSNFCDPVRAACKRNMKADLEKAAVSFETESQAMMDSFKKDSPQSGEKMSTAEALAELQKLTQRLEKNRVTEENLRRGMEVFDQTLEENSNLTAVESGIKLLSELWGMKGEWDAIWDGYKTGKFAELKTDTMEETAGKFMKKVMMKKKEAGPMPIWSEMKTSVDRFRATMPLISDLSNKDLRERHWQQLMDQVGTKFDYEGDDFTLEKVIELGLDQHAEFIAAASGSASKEYQVEKSIMDIRENWSTMQLETVPYRERGHYRIKSVEELYAALDDNSVVLSTLKATKFGKPFMEEIVFWEKTLSAISETLEGKKVCVCARARARVRVFACVCVRVCARVPTFPSFCKWHVSRNAEVRLAAIQYAAYSFLCCLVTDFGACSLANCAKAMDVFGKHFRWLRRYPAAAAC